MLAEGLHGQVLRKSVCFGVVDEILLGSEKRAEEMEMVRFTIGLFDRKFAIKTKLQKGRLP